MRGIYSLAANRLASQEGLCTMEYNCLISVFNYQPEDGQWKGPKHIVDLNIINHTFTTLQLCQTSIHILQPNLTQIRKPRSYTVYTILVYLTDLSLFNGTASSGYCVQFSRARCDWWTQIPLWRAREKHFYGGCLQTSSVLLINLSLFSFPAKGTKQTTCRTTQNFC